MRKTGSYSRNLTDKLIKHLIAQQDLNEINSEVVVRDLADGIPLIDENWIKANFTAVDERTFDQHKYLMTSDILVNELMNADKIVIGLPIYNFAVPAAFKAWIDQVVRSKLTFKYGDNGPVGLVSNKKVYIIIASGGTQLGTELDFISNYLRHVLGFIGFGVCQTSCRDHYIMHSQPWRYFVQGLSTLLLANPNYEYYHSSAQDVHP
jgi:FMN-dependent NADH-azoreductase